MEYLTNYTYEEIEIGQQASLQRTLSHQDIILFASVSGDINPIHLDAEFAKKTLFGEVIAHGMWSGIFISTLLGTQLPGPGTIYVNENLQFRRPVKIGDTLTVTITAMEKQEDKKRIIFSSSITNQDNKVVVLGSTVVIAPTEKIRVAKPQLPRVEIQELD
jgi:3-hydroxybutyryl-CoA dehydratase